MAALVERCAVLAGADPLMLPLLRQGDAGCITATSNLVARDLAFVSRHFAEADRAAEVEAAQARVAAPRDRVSRSAQIGAIRAARLAAWRRHQRHLCCRFSSRKTSPCRPGEPRGG